MPSRHDPLGAKMTPRPLKAGVLPRVCPGRIRALPAFSGEAALWEAGRGAAGFDPAAWRGNMSRLCLMRLCKKFTCPALFPPYPLK